jgi:hypothetical protein
MTLQWSALTAHTAPTVQLAAVSAPAAAASLRTETAVMLLADMAPHSRAWGWWCIAAGPRRLQSVPGLRFAKVMGSGKGGGFGLRPSPSHHAVFAVFGTRDAARDFVEDSAVLRAYRKHARELCTLELQAYACRGAWAGTALRPAVTAPAHGPIAALTRASIHPLKARAFWRLSPAAEDSLQQAPGCWLAAGMGEAPLLRQATFSVWDSVSAMDAYARSGAHLVAIRAAQLNGYFSESMFVRFAVLAVHGRWQGRDHG